MRDRKVTITRIFLAIWLVLCIIGLIYCYIGLNEYNNFITPGWVEPEIMNTQWAWVIILMPICTVGIIFSGTLLPLTFLMLSNTDKSEELK
jgi:hypothetical protein